MTFFEGCFYLVILLSACFFQFICCAIIIAIIQYCNFCQLCYWMRSTIATLVGLAMVTLLFSFPCRYEKHVECNEKEVKSIGV